MFFRVTKWLPYQQQRLCETISRWKRVRRFIPLSRRCQTEGGGEGVVRLGAARATTRWMRDSPKTRGAGLLVFIAPLVPISRNRGNATKLARFRPHSLRAFCSSWRNNASHREQTDGGLSSNVSVFRVVS